MTQVFAAFGIDWRLLIINSVNFGLLMLALWYFLYGPLTKMLDTRREKLANGVRDAESAKLKLEEIEQSRASMLAQAGTEADAVLAHARAAGVARERELAQAGEAAATAAVREAEQQAHELKAQALVESKQEVAKLIVLGIDKLQRQQYIQ
ncbi:MAG: ATP synthase F0 subunit B [bacterium]|nr:ATP synthase F0 subunit B [bacterium]